jgi:hypothetical protein
LTPPQKFAKISWQTASENDIVSFLKLRGLVHRERDRERDTERERERELKEAAASRGLLKSVTDQVCIC